LCGGGAYSGGAQDSISSWIYELDTGTKEELLLMISNAVHHYGGDTDEARLDVQTKFQFHSLSQVNEAFQWATSDAHTHSVRSRIEKQLKSTDFLFF